MANFQDIKSFFLRKNSKTTVQKFNNKILTDDDSTLIRGNLINSNDLSSQRTFDDVSSSAGVCTIYSKSPLISIKGLNKTLGDAKVINNFSLDIRGGEVMCILGNNGSGKTTLINLLTGLMRPDEESGGDAVLRTENDQYVSLREQLREFRSYVRLCQQNDFLFEEMTAREHLVLVCKLRGIVDPNKIND